MPVGTGSIKRAAKANVAAGTKAGPTPEVKEEKPVAKKAVAPKKATPKKAAPKKAEPVVESTCNQVCHLTEELPIHLL